MDKGKYFRRIPKVDILLEEAKKEGLLTKYDRDLVVAGIRQVTDELRSFLGRCEQEQAAERRLDTVMELLKERLEDESGKISYWGKACRVPEACGHRILKPGI